MVARKASVSSMNIQIEAEALRGHGAAPVFYQSSSQRSHNLFTAIQIFLCITKSSFHFFPSLSLVLFSLLLLSLMYTLPVSSCSFSASVFHAVHFPVLGNNESQQQWVAMCVALYRSAVINRACQLENENASKAMPSTHCCCLFEKETQTNTHDRLPDFSTSFHSARKTSVAH